jgi:hypothetical protein
MQLMKCLSNWLQQEAQMNNQSPRFKLLRQSDLVHLPPMSWLVKGVLPATGTAVIFGPSASGKSFLCLDLAITISQGEPWFGQRVKATPVVYASLEATAGIKQRTDAWSIHYETDIPANLSFILDPINLTLPNDVVDLANTLPKGCVVFIDTLNRAAPTADENSSKDMGAILQSAEILQRSSEGLVIIVHHTGKDTSKGMRGHSSLFAAMDGAIEVTKEQTGRHWSVAKSKDGEDGKEVAFRLVTHSLGKDSDGEEVTSCSVERDTGKLFTKPPPTGKRQQQALKVAKSELAKGTTHGMGGSSASTQCVKVEDLIPVIAATLTTTDKNKRTNEAKKVLNSLIDGDHLESGLDAAEDGWCWLPA